jgi:hypothetical protein
VKHFYNARNAIPYIQDIKVINVFRDGVGDIKIVEEISIKSLKWWSICLQLLMFALKALRLNPVSLNHATRGPPRKKQQDNQEVNTADHGDHGNRRNRQQQPAKQKEKRLFRRHDDAEKWCEIHHTIWHNLEECKTFLDRMKMSAPQVVQEQRRGEHRWANTDNEDQMDEINVIFRGSLSISSKTQGKRLEREISLDQRIKPDRKMK